LPVDVPDARDSAPADGARHARLNTALPYLRARVSGPASRRTMGAVPRPSSSRSWCMPSQAGPDGAALRAKARASR